MTKLSYANEVCRQLNMEGYETTIEENYRNNGSMVGILVKTDDQINPVFSVGEESMEPKEFVNYILSNLPVQAKINIDSLNDVIQDKNEVLNRVSYVLVNSSMNESRPNVVRRRVNDTLEIQYKIDVADIFQNGHISITNQHLERLQLDSEELYSRAYSNTMERFPYRLCDISQFLFGMPPAPEIVMHVLTNEGFIYGAGAILYEGMHDILTDTIGGDFIVIPSSIHEVIVLPDVGENETITQMIKEVNGSVLAKEDILSDRPYKLISDGVLVEL